MSSEARELQVVEPATRRAWHRGWVLAVIWLALHTHTARADDSDVPPGQLTFRVFGSAAGLHNLVIRSIAQDGNGSLWVGTEDGLYRLDGDRFTRFTQRDGLRSSRSSVVGVAPDGAICVGSDGGLVCWDGARFSPASAAGLPARPVVAMASAVGRLWVAMRGGGLYVRGAGGGFVAAAGWPGAPTTPVRALWADADGVVAGNGATLELSAGDGVWKHLGDVGLGAEVVDGVLRDHQGALWIRSQRHLWFLPRGAARATDLRDGLPSAFESAGAQATMAIGPCGDVLIATDDGVSYREHDRWRAIDGKVGFPRSSVRTLFVDREANLWLASAALVQLRGHGLIEHHDAASGLPGDVVWVVQRDRQSRLFAGTNRCLARASAAGWSCVPGTEGRVVSGLAFPPQGGTFVGGAPSDLLYIDPAGHATSLESAGRPEHNIVALAITAAGDLWIGRSDGLYRLRGATPGPIERVDVAGLAGATVVSLVVDEARLWVASTSGLFVLDRGAWHRFAAADGFRADSMQFLTVRSDGRLCTTYYEALGLTCFGYDGRGVIDLVHLRAADGLASDTLYYLGEDRAHRLWVGTGDGVDLVTAHGIAHFDEADGLVGNDAAANAFFLDRDGSVWLGATGGATHLLAQSYGGPPAAPSTAFLAARLGDQPFGAGALEVPHDRSGLTLECSATSLVDASRIEYELRLSPFETASSTTHQRTVRYPALVPGSYRFTARARIDGGPWGPVSELRFTVLPAWWETGWFLALLIAVGLLAVAGGFATRQRAVLLRRTRLLNEQSDASFRAVIDLMPDLITVHRGGALIYVNLGCRRFLGIDRQDGPWQLADLTERVHPDDRAPLAALFRTVDGLELQLAACGSTRS
jgi:ligand-binding sensor domain-containing protein